MQNYSIKMVKMQPELLDSKVRFFGDRERIADEHALIFKKYKYNPFASIVPMLIQLILLMGVIEVIKIGLADPSVNNVFWCVSLGSIPSKTGGWYYLFPVLAAASALAMCICQNKSNVLQVETSKAGRIITLLISVGLSFYLGFFVTVGVVIYWICSNILAIATLYILNFLINPKKYVDYEKLSESKKALDKLEKVQSSSISSNIPKKELSKRENRDYKRFFSVVNKHLVFYSESNGFYKYYKGLIEYLLNKTNLTIHYITGDPCDDIFKLSEKEPRIRAYYIGEKKLITLMMRMDADIVAMTMPDLDNFHIKKSYIRRDIEYLYIQHGIGSVNMLLRKGALDNYDSVFCCGEIQKQEIIAMEKLNHTKEKTLIDCGYFLLDDMIEAYRNMTFDEKDKKMILIAPSWQDGNIIDSCLDKILLELCDKDWEIVVRPHPQHVRHEKERLELLKNQYEKYSNIVFQLDFSSTDTVWKADLLITDWSDIATEYAFCTQNPVLFVDTPMKIMNPDYDKIDVIPLNIVIRNIAGESVGLDELDKISEIINTLLEKKEEYSAKISEFEKTQVYNIGHSAEIGGKYIVEKLLERKKAKL